MLCNINETHLGWWGDEEAEECAAQTHEDGDPDGEAGASEQRRTRQRHAQADGVQDRPVQEAVPPPVRDARVRPHQVSYTPNIHIILCTSNWIKIF